MANQEKRTRDTVPVQVKESIKIKVEKKVAGTKTTIGEFFGEAAIEKIKNSNKKSE